MWIYLVIEQDAEKVSILAAYRSLEAAQAWHGTEASEWMLDQRNEAGSRWYHYSCNVEIHRIPVQ